MPVTTGTPRTRALAAALRRAREVSGQGLRNFANSAGVHHASLSMWETGKRVPRVEDVATILAHLGVTGGERERILELARHATEPNWLAPGVSEQLDGVMECERTARRITNWSPLLIPGLLQTYDYAQSIIGTDRKLSRKEIEANITLRMGRRDVLTRPDATPMLALVSERAIYENIQDQSLAIAQLRYLVEVSEWSAVTLRIVRVSDDWSGRAGPFVLYDFDDAPPIVHLEHLRSGVFLYDEDHISAFQEAVTDLCARAMSPEDSIRFIKDVIERMKTSHDEQLPMAQK